MTRLDWGLPVRRLSPLTTKSDDCRGTHMVSSHQLPRTTSRHMESTQASGPTIKEQIRSLEITPDLCSNSSPARTPNHTLSLLAEGSRNRRFATSQTQPRYRQGPSRRHLSLTSPQWTHKLVRVTWPWSSRWETRSLPGTLFTYTRRLRLSFRFSFNSWLKQEEKRHY